MVPEDLPGWCWPVSSIESYLTSPKINGQVQTAKEVESKQTVDTCAGRQRVAEHWKIRALLPKAETL